MFPTTGGAGLNFWVDVLFTEAKQATLVAIGVSPFNPSIPVGSTQQFRATGIYSDDTTRDLTGQVSWTSATPAVATVDSTGLATGKAVGSSVITANVATTRSWSTLTVRPATPPPTGYTLFSSTAAPAGADANAGTALELGLRFTADRDGYVTAARFYKGEQNLGTHVASLWTRTGALLAQATFSNESPSGWQQVTFSSPVRISAFTEYVISYHSSGQFSYDAGYFRVPVDSQPLHAPVGNNGVYSYGAASVFPATSSGGLNFWVDLVFQ